MNQKQIDEIRARDFEIWKDIPEFEGYYQISNMGRVKSLDRTIYYTGNRIRTQFIKGAILSPSKRNKYGHMNVTLRKNGRGITKQVHRLVADAFCRPLLVVMNL